MPGLGDNSYKPHSSFLNVYKAKRGRGGLFSLLQRFNTPKILDYANDFMPFYVENGGVFIGPYDFRIRAKKKYDILRIQGSSGTTTIIG